MFSNEQLCVGEKKLSICPVDPLCRTATTADRHTIAEAIDAVCGAWVAVDEPMSSGVAIGRPTGAPGVKAGAIWHANGLKGFQGRLQSVRREHLYAVQTKTSPQARRAVCKKRLGRRPRTPQSPDCGRDSSHTVRPVRAQQFCLLQHCLS